jgi:2-polyprenyl-6-methoxyphenol hydroxylase-like FAD-dependent oxidoreductase
MNPDAAPARIETRCCIAGGGPAGIMLGFLLARAGIDVVVLEKHADFLRDFRGDTIHPSTLEIMHELGILERLLERPHQKVFRLRGMIEDEVVTIADFSHVPTRCRYIALMPQWDFLDFLWREGARYPGFHLHMRAEATGLLRDADRITGVSASTPDGPLEVVADLVVGADGRRSTIRQQAALPVEDLGAPMDVLWFGLPRKASDPEDTMGRFVAGRIFVMIDRGDAWQFGLVIAKGTIEDVRAAGLEAFRAEIVRMAPFVADRVGLIAAWDAVKLLTVTVDRLREWARPGLLCIGDAAHAMSPIGGVGINLAIQDAVAAANLLWEPLRRGAPDLATLSVVQRRRWYPTWATQALQVAVQKRVLSRVLAGKKRLTLPWIARLLQRVPLLAAIPARLVGVGVRPEHVRSPELATAPLSHEPA